MLGERLWLFHRGNTEQGLNIVADVPLGGFLDGLRGGGRIDPGEEPRTRA